MNYPKTRKIARETNNTFYFTGNPCSRNHTSVRYAISGKCKECERLRSAAWRANNHAKVHDMNVKWYRTNKEAILEYNKQWSNENKERIRESKQKWRAANPEKVRTSNEMWREKLRSLYTAHEAKRRARKRNATPVWANNDQIRALYAQAKELSDMTGIPHEVDHIIPLKNDLVCGLHCEANLQIISRSENRRKYNKLIPISGNCGFHSLDSHGVG